MQRFIESQRGESPKSSKPYILLVEDAIVSQLLVKKQLENAKYSVIVANTGPTALSQYKLFSHSIKIILMDINIPEMNGIETTSKIRELKLQPVLIFALTSSLDKDLDKYKNAGMDGYFYKGDFNIYMLEEAIQLIHKHTFITKEIIDENFHPTLLLVDDMKVSIKLSLYSLKNTEYIVDYASSGTKAIERYIKHIDSINIILMDINMPDINGCRVTEKIREIEKVHSKNKPILILGLTANFDKTNFTEYIESGLNGCISKGQNLILALENSINQYNQDPNVFIDMTKTVHN